MRNVRKPDRFVEWVGDAVTRMECSKCMEVKDACEFGTKKSHSTKLSPSCKRCDSQIKKKQYLKNSESVKKRINAYRLANIEKIKQKKKEYNKLVRTQLWWKETLLNVKGNVSLGERTYE